MCIFGGKFRYLEKDTRIAGHYPAYLLLPVVLARFFLRFDFSVCVVTGEGGFSLLRAGPEHPGWSSVAEPLMVFAQAGHGLKFP